MNATTTSALPPLAPAPAQGMTHLLRWVPPYVTGRLTGWWDLQAADGGTLDGPALSAPRGAHPRDLARWATSQLGYPVLLELGYVPVTRLRALRLRHPEPVYYVQADPFAALRRDDGRDTFSINAYGDSVAGIEAAATAAARELYGPDSQLCTDYIDTITASWRDEERGRYHANVTVRCLNYHAIAGADL